MRYVLCQSDNIMQLQMTFWIPLKKNWKSMRESESK
jgi:hypothetical protein